MIIENVKNEYYRFNSKTLLDSDLDIMDLTDCGVSALPTLLQCFTDIDDILTNDLLNVEHIMAEGYISFCE